VEGKYRSTNISDAIFVVCRQTFALFWSIKTAVPVKIFRYSFRVFSCACPTVISSISGKSFHFPFPYFLIHSVLIIDTKFILQFKKRKKKIFYSCVEAHHWWCTNRIWTSLITDVCFPWQGLAFTRCVFVTILKNIFNLIFSFVKARNIFPIISNN